MIAYFLLPPRLLVRLGHLGYLGAFAVAAIANASVILPIPYYPLIARLAQAFDIWGIVISAAAGSALGETTAFFVGRTGREAIEETKISKWIKDQMQHPWHAAFVLFALSAPPNPIFDVAGILAGAFGVPLWLFLIAVFLGRIIRMALVAFIGLGLDFI